MTGSRNMAQVSIDPRLELGMYANAFRVLDSDIPAKVFLEFLLYSPTVNRATVVSRVRAPRKLLPIMVTHLQATLSLLNMPPGSLPLN